MANKTVIVNPFLEALGPYLEPPDWPGLLERNPLDDFPKNPSLDTRDEYLDYAHGRFAVTRKVLTLAESMQSMMRSSYRERDPNKLESRRALFQIAALEDAALSTVQTYYSNARAMKLAGITGMGKSVAVEHILSIYPQVVVHGENKACDWYRRTQVIHLTVRMSHDGSRGGFLRAILMALDEALSSDYFNEYGRKRVTVEMLVLQVSKLLAIHMVGLLVIEEMQAENFMESQYQKDLILFFLSVLSFGVPLLLIGNPLAFRKLSLHKQSERRYNTREPLTLWPYESPDDPDWDRAIAPAIWNFQVVDDRVPYSSAIGAALWRCSGGIPAYAQKLVQEVQRSILRRSTKQLSVNSLIDHYLNLESFQSFRPLVEGLVSKDDALLSEGIDIPVDDFVRRWKGQAAVQADEAPKSVPKKAAPIQTSSSPPDQKGGGWEAYLARELKKKKTAATKKKNKAKRNSELRVSTDTDDLRHADRVHELLNKSLEELKQRYEKDELKKT